MKTSGANRGCLPLFDVDHLSIPHVQDAVRDLGSLGIVR